jgi:hypothetical protein
MHHKLVALDGSEFSGELSLRTARFLPHIAIFHHFYVFASALLASISTGQMLAKYYASMSHRRRGIESGGEEKYHLSEITF